MTGQEGRREVMDEQEIEKLQEALNGEKEHSICLENLLKALYGNGWNKLTLFDAKKIYEHNKTLESRLKQAEETMQFTFGSLQKVYLLLNTIASGEHMKQWPRVGHESVIAQVYGDLAPAFLRLQEALKGLGKDKP